MRLDHLGAVGEVTFEAVVVQGIVAGGDDHAGIGAGVADGEGELGGGARSLEEEGIAAVLDGDICAKLGELAGEMAGVMGNAEFRPAGPALGGEVILQVGDEALGGARDVEVIHRVGADARELGPAERLRRAGLGPGDDFADGAAAQPASAEGERAEEAVVELGPGGEIGQSRMLA